MQYGYILWALMAGVVLPFQIGLNHLVAKGSTPMWSAAISFIVGFIGLGALIFVTRQPMLSMAALGTVPWYAWVGGFLGAFYVASTIFVAPVIGVSFLVALTVAGQLLASLYIDHHGLIGFTQQPISLGRLMGAMLLVIGVVLIKKC